MENPEEKTTSFHDLLQIVSSRKGLILVGFLSVFVVATVGTFKMPPVYEVSTTIMVEPTDIPYLGMGSLSFGAREVFIANQKQIIRSRIIAEKVVRQLQLDENPSPSSFFEKLLNKFFQINPDPFKEAVRGLQKSVFVGSTGGPNIIEIGMKAKDPLETTRILNALAQVYIDYSYEASVRKTRGTYDFIREQVKVAQLKLDESDRALREYKEKEKMASLPAETANILTRLSELNASLSGALAEYSDKDPRVVRTKEEISRLIAKLESLPEKELKLARLDRAVKSNEEIYLLLLKRLEEARISEVAEMRGMGTARVIDPAFPPPYPLRRQRAIFVILGAVMGLVFGLGMAFFAEYRDSSIKASRDVEQYLRLKVLGIIPSTPKKIRKHFLGFKP